MKSREALNCKAEQVLKPQSRTKFSTGFAVKEETCLKIQASLDFLQVFHRIKTKSFPDFAAEEGKISTNE